MKPQLTEKEITSLMEIRDTLADIAFKFDCEGDMELVNNFGSVCSHIDIAISSLNTILYDTTPINIEL